MGIKNSRYRVKNSEGSYDVIHFETSANQVLTSDDKQFVSENEKQRWNSIASSSISKHVSNIGDGTSKIFTVNHRLDTKDITCTIIDNSTNQTVVMTCKIRDNNNIELEFIKPPATNEYRVVIIG